MKQKEMIIIPITRETVERNKAETNDLSDIIKNFVETGCYSPENPNQNQNWCSCGKPFCYDCVAWQVVLRYRSNLVRLQSRETP